MCNILNDSAVQIFNPITLGTKAKLSKYENHTIVMTAKSYVRRMIMMDWPIISNNS